MTEPRPQLSQVLTQGTAHLSFTLPNHGADLEAYYVVFRAPDGKNARFTVSLSKIQKASARRNMHFRTAS